MKVLVFGGTTEGRLLAQELASLGAETTVSVATALGAEELAQIPGLRILVGRLDTAGMEQLLAGFDLCVDATHPYAKLASETIRAACRSAGVPLRRALREQSALPEDCTVVSSAKEAESRLLNTQGNILLTTGAKELGSFAALPRERLYVRVLPMTESIAACEKAEVPHSNIIAMQGPFSQQLNEALIHQFHISYLVTKDGGAAGGFREKAEAARCTGVCLIVIRRPLETGEEWKHVLQECRERLQCK